MTSCQDGIRLKCKPSLMLYMEINMKSLFESLLRLYEFDGPAPAESQSKALESIEGRLLDPSAKDGSTFPYLP
jgi:hypothetical protein